MNVNFSGYNENVVTFEVSGTGVTMGTPVKMESSHTVCACEDGEIAKGVLDNIIENFEIADSENVPICQDTGMACVFLEIGQDVHFVGGDFSEAIHEGVRRGFEIGGVHGASPCGRI